MENNGEAIDSKTSIIVNDGRQGFQKWNGDQWEQLQFTAGSDEEIENLESGLPMKVLKFMGLPKSYRHTLYNEFVQDVSQIPADTASSFYNIVSWICGENEDGGSKKSRNSSMGEGDTHRCRTVANSSSTESIGGTSSNVFRTDSLTNIQLVTPFGVVMKREAVVENPVVEMVEAIELSDNINITSCMVGDEKKQPVAHVLELDRKGNVVRIPSMTASASETSIFGYGVSESENEGGFVNGTADMESTIHSDKEDEGEEVKRVTFAPSSETNIYAYQNDNDTEAESRTSVTQTQPESVVNVEESKHDEGHETAEQTFKKNEEDLVEIKEEEDEERKPPLESKVETPKAYVTVATSFHDMTELANENLPTETQLEAKKSRHVAISNDIAPVQENCKESNLQTGKAAPSTSEVQLQLNKDLKTLEEIVKKLYKNLNKKGPVTIVANFKPKKEGELALDMGSLTGNPQPQGATEKKSKEAISQASQDVKAERGESATTVTGTTTETTENENVSSGQRKEVVVHASKSRSSSTSISAKAPPPPPVSIMKHSTRSSTTQQHQGKSSTTQSRQSINHLPKPPVIPSTRSHRVTDSKATVDRNNNKMKEPILKPALKSRMPLLRPAASSHSVTRTAIVNKAELGNPAARTCSRSKHYLVRAPSSQHVIVKQPPPQPQHYKILEGSNSKRYLVPVSAPQQVRSPSQHVLVEAPSSRHFLLDTPSSNPQHVILESPRSQHVFLENLEHTQQKVVMEKQRSVQHILVETPPPSTCQNPHLHPRTATILPPPSATGKQFPGDFSKNAASPQPRQSSYRLIQPCGMHANHHHHHDQPEHDNYQSRHNRRRSSSRHNLPEDSAEDESGSNTSRVSSASSTFSGADYNFNNNTGASGGDTGDTGGEEGVTTTTIPIHITTKTVHQTSSQHHHHEQQHRSAHNNSKKPSVMLSSRGKQSTESLVSSQSGTSKQYRTTLRIPTGPPKPNSYRAIFQEKQQQQQKQTVYVDLTSKGLKMNR